MYGKGIVKILVEKTLKEFNIDVASLSPSSHHKIYVKCNRCEEIFTREFRNQGQLHGCPTRIIREDGKKLKWCNKCEQFLSISLFHKNIARYDNLASLCKTCMLASPSAIQKNKKQQILCKENWSYWLKNLLTKKKGTCKNKSIAFKIDFDHMKEVWDRQDGKCYYFNLPLTFANKTLYSATLERVDNNSGYIKGNVVFASRMANFAKNDSDVEDFNIAIIKLITELTQGIPRIEIKKHRSDAVIPHRKRASDAGYDLHSLGGFLINPGQVVEIDTGLSVVAPFGYYVTIEGRSSMYRAGVVPFRGIIDGGYTGPMVVSLMNVGNEPYKIKKYDRIAQLTLHRLFHMDLIEVKEISEDYNIRGEAGFGSSGR